MRGGWGLDRAESMRMKPLQTENKTQSSQPRGCLVYRTSFSACNQCRMWNWPGRPCMWAGVNVGECACLAGWGFTPAEMRQPRCLGAGAHLGNPSRCPGRWSSLPSVLEPGFQGRCLPTFGSRLLSRAPGCFTGYFTMPLVWTMSHPSQEGDCSPANPNRQKLSHKDLHCKVPEKK